MQRVLKVRLRDTTFRIAINNIPIRTKTRFMDDTGKSVEWFFDESRFGAATLCALWFLSHLLDGDGTTWDATQDAWDAADFKTGDFELAEVTEGDDPEA